MKDERTTQVLQKIYSELVLIIIFACAISMVVKVLVWGKGLEDCIVEWFILVGTPIYQAVRARMLQISLSGGPFSWKRTVKSSLVSVLTVLIIFGFVAIFRPGNFTVKFIISFLVPYIVIFLLIRIGMTKLEERREKRLGDEYDDD